MLIIVVTNMSYTNKKIIGSKIKQQRKRLGLTQFDLAEKVGLHEKQISRIESGLNYPTFENFVNIINALELNMSDFSPENVSENNELKDELFFIIKNSSVYELKMYLDVINAVKKNMKNYKTASINLKPFF